MMAINKWNPHRVGIAGGVALLLMALLVGYLGAASFGKAHLAGYFQHTAGLRVGEDVQVAGVSVGQVTGIALAGTKVRVDFTIDKKIHLGADTTASVKVATLLGTHYLEIVPQGPGTVADIIPLAHTFVPFNLQDVIQAAGDSLQKYDSKKISQSFTVMADALRGTPEATRRALVGVSDLSRVAADRSEQMRLLLSSARTVTGQLAKDSSQIIDLLKQSNLVLDELVKRRVVIHQMLVDSERLATAISGVIDDNNAQFAPLMKNLSSTLKLLRQHDDGLQKSIGGLAYTSRFFANATGNGPWMDLHVPVIVPDNIACINPTGGCK